MDYCGPRGIPHSRFLDWSTDDQEKALWWMARERQRCNGCGTHPDEWNEDLGGSREAYKAEERTCPGCRERGPAADALDRARNAGDPKHGTSIALIPNRPDTP